MKILVLLLSLSLFNTSLKSQTIHIYAGADHDIYLGCLNCDKYDQNSIWNEYGTYGSKYNSYSIWNKNGTYGSKYNSYSPWNAHSSSPPVLVDANGGFYGYFTLNKYKAKRAEFSLVLTLYKFYDLIPNDVGKWYEKLFE